MSTELTITARWDGEASVWTATSADVPGLVIESDTWPSMIDEVKLALPDLMELNGQARDGLSLTFRAEEHVELAAPQMAELYARLADILRKNGCRPVRPGKGSHEMWFSPITGRHVTVPRSTKSRHTANDVLKQAGLPKAF